MGKLNARQAVPLLQKILAQDQDSFARRSAAIALSRLNVHESLGPIFEQFRLAQTPQAQRELALALANLVHGPDLYYRIRRREARGIAEVLGEAIDQALAESHYEPGTQKCFAQMLQALRLQELEQIRAIALRAIDQALLHRPTGKAGELTDYLLRTAPAEPWPQEHAALLIFLLLKESQQRSGPAEYHTDS